MKKICFVTTISLTLDCFILPLAEYLHTNTDWDISFICSDDEKFAKRLPEYIHYFPVHMERGISFAGIKAMLEIKKIFKREKFDLVQYTTPNASLYSAIASSITNVPIRVYNQGGIIYVGFNGIKKKIFKIVEKITCKLSTNIECVSKSNLAFAVKEKIVDENKATVIWNGSVCGVDFKKFDINKKQQYKAEILKKYSIPYDSFVFVFIGRVTRDKGINELLYAFKNSKTDNDYLFMVGNNEVDSTIDKDLYDWSVKDDKVIYTGNVSDVEKYLSAADCFVMPSYREGFGVSIIEAEAMGVPVIVTDIPGPIDAMLPNETGILVKKADKESLENAMCSIKSQNLKKIGEAGHSYAYNKFEQTKLFNMILLYLKSLI